MSVPGVPWGALSNYFSAPRVTLEGNEQTIPHVLIQPSDTDPLRSLLQKRNGQGRLAIDMPLPAPVFARNVMGVIRGSDATLREEYVAVTAHYDHVGVNRSAGQDSIFNGARDNAIGTTLLIETAQFFAKNPPKRSILLIAYTAEEKGLLGSHWYADHPVVPLKQTIFNLNCDGAGYNDTSIATIIDFNRTTADDLLRQACTAAGLMLKGDPAPEQGLFDRSDNVSLAKKGVPAVNVSPGVKAFDQELMKYYHQPADEVSTLDMVYLAKFYRAMLRGVLLIGNAKGAPAWKEGDKYEAAAKELYAK
jgi:Zn-dependent M28 family amino/carboxypeptidase